ncbi:YrdB family protein [Psychrobacillus sp. NEAU-3TGS]|uniref:YrdB family protein n=1 Tax=Psychrobacillus sp. NEAU-3TGS TaxID=2995412 RepID=UPI002498E10A|nr:YrdB family protein [Psychrobacillus sp. NEAU-3TGS]MDI2587303.1 YrdB family protein [Psychrobacillus sp. NEAU-3TGS]
MQLVHYTVFGLFFLMELGALAAFSYWGFHMNRGWLISSLLGLGTPLLVAIFWGTFIAPKASIPVSIPLTILLQSIIFALAVAALHFSDKSKLAIIFGVVVLIEMILMYTIED